MSSSYSYYHEELSFLLQGGQALSKAFPRAADRLAGKGFDPDVERLLEGIAFITGRIHQKHDQSLNEISQLMFDILFPHFLCPIPSTAVVQLEGESGLIPRGSKVTSVPVLGTPCQFQTTYDVCLGPLNLEEVSWQNFGGRGAQLTLHLSCRKGVEELLNMGPLRLFLQGEPLLTRSLFFWLLTRLEQVELLDAQGKTCATAKAILTRPLGYSEDEALFIYPEGSFSGFRLIQEYFTLPQKFMFLDVLNLGPLFAQLSPKPQTNEDPTISLALRFSLRTDAAYAISITRQNFRLNCTPVVNLFQHTADPVLLESGKTEYLVRPAGSFLHYQIYRILEVEVRSPGKVHPYPLLSELEEDPSISPFCQLLRRKINNEMATYIFLHGPDQFLSDHQTLLIDLLCSNDQLPSGLRMGDRCKFRPPLDSISCHFITPLTTPGTVVMDEMLRWKLVKHLALSQRDLSSLECVRDVLSLYNPQASLSLQIEQALSLLLRSLLSLEKKTVQHRRGRVKIWGRSLRLTIDESAFDSEGELYLFGCILNEFMALQSPINVFTEFSILHAKSQEVYQWPRRLGPKLLETS